MFLIKCSGDHFAVFINKSSRLESFLELCDSFLDLGYSAINIQAFGVSVTFLAGSELCLEEVVIAFAKVAGYTGIILHVVV